MNLSKIKKFLHDIFLIGIVIKGIDGILEFIAGVILIFVRMNTVIILVHKVFQHELLQEPNDFFANFMIQLFQNMSISTISFASLYFVIHGLIKIGLSFGLWSRKLWFYPLAGIVLFLSVIYQSFRILHTHSVVLMFLTLIDILILVLLRFEYKKLLFSSREGI